ncbi:16140_t:CDS:1, partial [Cetraspora pellucida]
NSSWSTIYYNIRYLFIMWEILYGMPVSYDHKFGGRQLQLKICYDDLRPPVNKEATICYVNLMKECWDQKPEKRHQPKTLKFL